MQRNVTYGYLETAQSKPELIEVIPRRDFLLEFRRDYKPGQHVTILGPTGRGKSRLCYQMLSMVISPDMPVISLHGKIKGRDPVVARAAKQLDLRVVPALPSAMRQRYDRQRKRNGYLILPLERPGKSAKAENDLLAESFGDAIHHNYTRVGEPTITHINETHQTQVELKLKEECERQLMRGGPDAAQWNEGQRGRYLSYHTYGAPEHIILFYDDDRSNRQRYADFGTADPDVVEAITANLKTDRSKDGRTISQCLYMRRSGGMYVIDT